MTSTALHETDKTTSHNGIKQTGTTATNPSQTDAKTCNPPKEPETQPKNDTDPDSDDPDSLLAALEAEESAPGILYPPSAREAHAQSLATEARAARQYRPSNPAHSAELVDHLISLLATDDALLSFTTQQPRCVVLFAHPEFQRCAVMETHLRRLVLRHGGGGGGTGTGTGTGGAAGDVRFGRVPDVRTAPFVVEKLGVRVLPCVIGFVDGVAVGRIVGFEGLGLFRENVAEQGGVGVTRRVEEVLVGWKVFEARTHGWEGFGSDDEDDQEEEEGGKKGSGIFGTRRGIQGPKKRAEEDEDDDWD